ncbi:MAG TPA: hypothetical protein PLI09_18800 [Candidatus Hydrogenedentes bacterium]|nr:hypothetical protein [Candidatus Hydrogenedentota bacterium]
MLKQPRKPASGIKRWILRIAAGVVFLILFLFLAVFHTALYHRVYRFPRESQAWGALREQRLPLARVDGWQEYKGTMHNHSLLSHDSDASWETIHAALVKTGCQFIFMADHCDEGKADFSKQWRGMHDGVIFFPGFEMPGGFMPWNLPESTILECGEDPKILAKQISDLGGMLFFAHSEEKRLWELPELMGMEIYNPHTDIKDENLLKMLPDLLLNLGKYPDLCFRLIFDRQDAILKRWDDINTVKKLVGISANDVHQNNGLRGYYTKDDCFKLSKTNRDDVGQWKLNAFTRFLLRLFFGPLEPGKQLFRWELDPYERPTRFVNNHFLAKELSEEALLDALRQGRLFIGFDMIADSTGFAFFAEANGQKAVMGETFPFSSGVLLKAASPLPCRFTIKRNGETVYQAEGRDCSWFPAAAGKYRVEAELSVLGEWVPWVYANPLELK